MICIQFVGIFRWPSVRNQTSANCKTAYLFKIPVMTQSNCKKNGDEGIRSQPVRWFIFLIIESTGRIQQRFRIGSKNILRGLWNFLRDRKNILRSSWNILRDRRNFLRDRRNILRGSWNILRDRRNLVRGSPKPIMNLLYFNYIINL